MSPAAVLMLAGAARLLTGRDRPAVAAGAVALAPLPVLAAAGAGGLIWLRRRLERRRTAEAAAGGDVVLLAELVGLGLSAGLALGNALGAAQRSVHPGLAAEVGSVLRAAAHGGLAAALAESNGRGRRIYLICARAVTTGAPLGPVLDAFVAELRSEERAARLEAARRLPVRLMVPLALLILPGFVLLTVGPAVLAALERFALPR